MSLLSFLSPCQLLIGRVYLCVQYDPPPEWPEKEGAVADLALPSSEEAEVCAASFFLLLRLPSFPTLSPSLTALPALRTS